MRGRHDEKTDGEKNNCREATASTSAVVPTIRHDPAQRIESADDSYEITHVKQQIFKHQEIVLPNVSSRKASSTSSDIAAPTLITARAAPACQATENTLGVRRQPGHRP